jgi:acetyltransferase
MTPLRDHDASEMIRGFRGSPLLFGFRGRPPADFQSIERLLLCISQLMEQVSPICQLDLNPVMVHSSGKGITVVDARIAVG